MSVDFGVGGFEHGVVDGDIFREVDEVLTSELLWINEAVISMTAVKEAGSVMLVT